MAKSLPDILYVSEMENRKIVPILDSDGSMYRIPLYKGEEYFSNIDSYVAFIKACEDVVRHHDRYSKYIYYLKHDVGLDHCQVLPDIEPDEKGKIKVEMHHGPIFTLYDYCEIMVAYFQLRKWPITTLRIADQILTEHQRNHIQVVMLLATVHEEVHNRNIFINYKQAWGDLNAFVRKYGEAIPPLLKEKMNKYIDKSLMYDSSDYGILKLSETLLNIDQKYSVNMEEGEIL